MIKHAWGKGVENLPLGKKINAASVLAASVGARHPDILGHDLQDKTGSVHPGISTLPIMVVKQPAGVTLNELFNHWKELGEVDVRGLTSATDGTNTYEAYSEILADTESPDVDFYAVALYGPYDLVTSLTPKEKFQLQ